MNKHEREYLKRQQHRHEKRLESFKGGKSKGKQNWNYLFARGMLDRHVRQCS